MPFGGLGVSVLSAVRRDGDELPNLLKLLGHIDGQARALTVEQWRARYAAARAVIAERILPQLSDDVIQAARAEMGQARLPPTLRELA